MNLDLSNPFVLVIGGIILVAVIVFWNKNNMNQTRKRRNRSFRQGYYERKEEREKE